MKQYFYFLQNTLIFSFLFCLTSFWKNEWQPPLNWCYDLIPCDLRLALLNRWNACSKSGNDFACFCLLKAILECEQNLCRRSKLLGFSVPLHSIGFIFWNVLFTLLVPILDAHLLLFHELRWQPAWEWELPALLLMCAEHPDCSSGWAGYLVGGWDTKTAFSPYSWSTYSFLRSILLSS